MLRNFDDIPNDIPNVDGVFVDEDEWSVPWIQGAGVLHVGLRRRADMRVPLSASSLAKITAGLADALLLSVTRTWDNVGIIDHQPGTVRRTI